MLKIDPVLYECSLMGATVDPEHDKHMSNVKNKWYGGIIGGNGAIYGIPFRSDRVIKIDPAKQQVIGLRPAESEDGEMTSGYEQNWHGGLRSHIDGSIWGFPANSNSVLQIHPDDTVQLHRLLHQRVFTPCIHAQIYVYINVIYSQFHSHVLVYMYGICEQSCFHFCFLKYF